MLTLSGTADVPFFILPLLYFPNRDRGGLQFLKINMILLESLNKFTFLSALCPTPFSISSDGMGLKTLLRSNPFVKSRVMIWHEAQVILGETPALSQSPFGSIHH